MTILQLQKCKRASISTTKKASFSRSNLALLLIQKKTHWLTRVILNSVHRHFDYIFSNEPDSLCHIHFLRCKMVIKTMADKGKNSLVKLTEKQTTDLLNWRRVFKLPLNLCKYCLRLRGLCLVKNKTLKCFILLDSNFTNPCMG